MTDTNFSNKLRHARATIQDSVLALRNDLKGVSGLEFAMIAPMLIGMYLGVAEVSLGVSHSRKVSRVAGTLADLVAQSTDVTSCEVDGIMNAAVAVMAPYDASGLVMNVVGVEIDEDENATVVWARANSGSTPAVGSSYPIPDDIRIADTFLVVSNVTYEYSPSLGANLLDTFHFDETNYNAPRLSTTVAFTSPTCT